MNDEEYFKRVSQDFDLDESIKATVWTAQWFINMGMVTMEEALIEFGLTQEQYDKFRKLPES